MRNRSDVTNLKTKLIMRRLYTSLTYEGSTILLLAGYKIIGFKLLLIILSIQALIYTPYLLGVLIRLNKLIWTFSFLFMILTPLSLMVINYNNLILRATFSGIALLMYYLFCWFLKFSVQSWLEKIEYSEFEYE
jgi:hypothetical protein